MPNARKPWEIKVLEGKPADLCKGKARGEDVNAEIQRMGLRPISDGGNPVLEWGKIRKASDFYAIIVREFEGLGFLYRPDLAVVGLVADCLERYHFASDSFRDERDPDEKIKWAADARKEADLFVKLSARLGLDPAARSKLTLNHSLVESLKRQRYEWDG